MLGSFYKYIEEPLEKINAFKEIWLKFVISKFHNELTPNILTSLRIALAIPLFILVMYYYYFMGFLIYFLGCLLDLFDGPLARARNLVSELGKILDPLADKILFILPLVIFVYDETVPYTLAFVLIFEEVTVMTLRITSYFFRIKKENNANIFGKIKMWMESAAVMSILLYPTFFFFNTLITEYLITSVLVSSLSFLLIIPFLLSVGCEYIFHMANIFLIIAAICAFISIVKHVFSKTNGFINV